MYIPLFIDVKNFKVLVIGCGNVGLRRIELFKKYGARITVVCRNKLEADGVETKNIDIQNLDLESLKKLIQFHDIIVVAVDNENLAKNIASIAMSLNKLVNNAVDYRYGNIIVPFKISINNVDIGLTSYGLSVELIRRIAQKIHNSLAQDIEINTLSEVFKILKKCVKENISSSKLRIKLYKHIYLDKEFNEYVKKGDKNKAITRAVSIIKELCGIDLKNCVEN